MFEFRQGTPTGSLGPFLESLAPPWGLLRCWNSWRRAGAIVTPQGRLAVSLLTSPLPQSPIFLPSNARRPLLCHSGE